MVMYQSPGSGYGMLTLLTVREDDELTCNEAPTVQRSGRTSDRTPCVRQATRETLWYDVFCNIYSNGLLFQKNKKNTFLLLRQALTKKGSNPISKFNVPPIS